MAPHRAASSCTACAAATSRAYAAATATPDCVSRSVMARPIPRVPPVTSATRVPVPITGSSRSWLPPAHSARSSSDAVLLGVETLAFGAGTLRQDRGGPIDVRSSAAGAPAGRPARGSSPSRLASCSASASTSDAGTARFTSPRRWASAPLTRSPSSRCSLAADRLVSNGQSTNPPAPSSSPSETRGSLRKVSSAITTRSHSSATVTPAPTAAPLTAATVGNGNRVITQNSSW